MPPGHFQGKRLDRAQASGGQLKIIAHRGASGYEYENSPAAFRRAAALGADGIELDVHCSRDGELVVHHDSEIPGLGLVAELDWTSIARQRLPNGDSIPRLADVLSLANGLELWVELKSLPSERDAYLIETLSRGPQPQRYAVHSLDHRIIYRLGTRQPALRRGLLSCSYPLDPLAPLRAAGADTLWQECHLLDLDLVTQLHQSGLTIVAWTANDDREVERLARLRVDAVCGDFPDRARQVADRAMG